MSRPAVVQQKLDEEKAAGAPMFMGFPDRWLDKPHWRCHNGHVSTSFLKADRGDLCLACSTPVWLTFPEDRDDESD